MLEVNIEKIIPVTDARDSLNKIVDEVSAGDELYVLTVNRKPTAVVVGVKHLEKLTGTPSDTIGSMVPAANTTDDSATTAASATDNTNNNPTPASQAAPVAEVSTPVVEPAPIPVAAEPASAAEPAPANTTPEPAAAAPADPNQFVTPQPVDLESIGDTQAPQNPVPPTSL